MYVVCVEFEIAPDCVAAFGEAVLRQAADSLRHEPECRRFDVARGLGERQSVFFLYELYDTEDAFRRHLATRHFAAFDALVAPWVRRKTVATYLRFDGVPGAAP
jgi:quinol monooxygenase YgiN